MGITAEMSRKVEEFYLKQNGYLVNIGDNRESCRISSLVDDHCLKCSRCFASAPVVSLGEIDRTYSESGLFAVGLLEIEDKNKCPFVKNFQEGNQDLKMLK